MLRSAKLDGGVSRLWDLRRRRIILRCEAGREPVGREEIGRPEVGSSGMSESSPSSGPSELLLEAELPWELSVPSPSVVFPPVTRWVRAPAHQLQSGQ